VIGKSFYRVAIDDHTRDWRWR